MTTQIADRPRRVSPYFKNLTGQRFTRLLVMGIEFDWRPGTRAHWICLCDCGNLARGIDGSALRRSDVRSCKCLQKELMSAMQLSHGDTAKGRRSTEYRSYTNAKSRCSNPNVPCYSNYGGRGIEFRFTSFEEFLSEVGRSPSIKHSLDRIDVNGHYEPGNVRWATMPEQLNNTRFNRHIQIDGVTRTVTQWAAITGLKRSTISQRLIYGWCDRCAVTVPVRGSKCRHNIRRQA